MASKKITWRDLVDLSDNKDIKAAIQQLKLLNKEYARLSRNMKTQSKHIEKALRDVQNVSKQLVASTQKLTVEQEKQTQGLTKMAASATKAATSARNLKQAKTEALKVEKAFGNSIDELTRKVKVQTAEFKKLDSGTAKGRAAMKKLGLEIQGTKAKIKDLTAVTMRQNNAFERAEGSYNALVKKNQQLRQALKNLPGAFSKNSKEVDRFRQKSKALETQIIKNNNRLKEFDKRIGDNFRNVGNYRGALGKAGASLKSFAAQLLVVTLGLQAMFQGVKQGFKSFTDFEFTITSVKALSGATEEQFALLEGQARDLGATTANTAGNIAQLQLELTKLGFKPEQILKMTKSINQLSIAFDSDLGATAKIVGGTMKAFNIEMERSSDVADAFAKASATSALDIEKIGVAMGNVAPAAAAANIPLETTLAIVGKLVDQNIDASSASTGFRNVLLELSSAGSKLGKALGGTVNNEEDLFRALDQLAEQGIDVTDSMIEAGQATGALGLVAELTGKRTAIALLSIVKNREAIQAQTDLLKNESIGFLQEYSEIMGGTVQIAMKEATSAAEGFAIALFTELKPAINGILTLLVALFSALEAGIGFLKQYKELFAALIVLLAAGKIQLAANAILQFRLNSAQAFGAIVTKNLNKAWKFLNATMKANPAGLVIAALLALVAALKFAERWTSRYEDTQRSLNRVLDITSESTEQLTEVNENLNTSINDINKMTDQQVEGTLRANKAIRDNALVSLAAAEANLQLLSAQSAQLTLWQKAQVAFATAASAGAGAALAARFAGQNIVEGTQESIDAIERMRSEIELLDAGIEDFETATKKRGEERIKVLKELSKKEMKAFVALQIFRLEQGIKWRQREFDEEGTHATRKVEIIRSNADDLLSIEQLKWEALQSTLTKGTQEYELAYEKFWGAIEQISFDTTQAITQIMKDEFIPVAELGVNLADVEKALEEGLARIKKINKKKSKGVSDDWKKTFSDIAKFAEEAFDNAADFASQLLENQIQDSEFKIEQVEKERARDVELAGNNQALIDQINADAELKRLKLEEKKRQDQEKQAKIDKAQAIFGAVIATALAVVKALPNVALSIIAGTLGAIGIATIAATPIPQFEKGTRGAPEGYAQVAEQGSELMIGPDGKVQVAHKPSVMWLEKGTKVLTAQQTSSLAEAALNNQLPNAHYEESSEKLQAVKADRTMQLMEQVNKGNRDVISAVSKMERFSFEGTKRGIRAMRISQDSRTELLNNRYG